MKLNKGNKYWVLAEVQDDGQVRVKKAQKLAGNQYKNYWLSVPSREMARALNVSRLVIK